jgi:hypothetical protein
MVGITLFQCACNRRAQVDRERGIYPRFSATAAENLGERAALTDNLLAKQWEDGRPTPPTFVTGTLLDAPEPQLGVCLLSSVLHTDCYDDSWTGNLADIQKEYTTPTASQVPTQPTGVGINDLMPPSEPIYSVPTQEPLTATEAAEIDYQKCLHDFRASMGNPIPPAVGSSRSLLAVEAMQNNDRQQKKTPDYLFHKEKE